MQSRRMKTSDSSKTIFVKKQKLCDLLDVFPYRTRNFKIFAQSSKSKNLTQSLKIYVTKKKGKNYNTKKHTPKKIRLWKTKKRGEHRMFCKKKTSTKTRKIESGTSFEVKTHVTPFSTKKN